MTNCCESSKTPHLLIIGGGSAAFSAAIEGEALGARVTIVNDGLPMGGTCVNVGCVPSKFLLRAAQAHHAPSHHGFAGIEGQSRLAFEDVIAQKRQLVGDLRQAKYRDVLERLDGVSYRRGEARFVGPGEVEVEGESLEADRIVIATGTSPAAPAIEGLREIDYLTNQTAFELERAPESLAVIGGGYVGLECAQLFSRFGTDVTVFDHTEILPRVGEALSESLAYYLREEGLTITEGAEILSVRREGRQVALSFDVDGDEQTIRVEHVLVAAGRRPNTNRLNVDDAGIAVDQAGFIETDASLETSIDGVFAAGDVIGDPMYVYTAAYEGKLAARNALGDESSPVEYHPLPWVVFTDPQVAGIGYDERQARQLGFATESTELPLSEVPRAVAARDTRGFIKLVRDREKDRLLGARILAPEGGELLMELSVAIESEMTVGELTDTLHPYLTLSEGLRLAAMTFEREVDELSCCAG